MTATTATNPGRTTGAGETTAGSATATEKVPFAALLHSAVLWEDALLDEISREMRREGLTRSVVVTYRADDAKDRHGRALLELRIARIDGDRTSVTRSPVDVLGYCAPDNAGTTGLVVAEAERARLQAFLGFNA